MRCPVFIFLLVIFARRTPLSRITAQPAYLTSGCLVRGVCISVFKMCGYTVVISDHAFSGCPATCSSLMWTRLMARSHFHFQRAAFKTLHYICTTTHGFLLFVDVRVRPYPICGLGRRMLACSVSQALLQGLRRMDVLSQVLSIRHNKLTACHGFCHSLNFLLLTDYCKAYIRPAQSIHYRRPVGHPEI